MSDSILDLGCSCHVSPPCSFCVETYECEKCGTRAEAEDQREEAAEQMLCDGCTSEQDQSDE